VVGRVVKVEMTFYISGGWESGGLGRVVGGGGADSMLPFWLKRGGDVMKHYQKMKQRQGARLDSMERKRDTALRCGNVDRRRGDTGEEKGRRQCQLG
jgi:hypothetical protein